MKRALLTVALVLVTAAPVLANGAYYGTSGDDVIRGSGLNPKASVIYGLGGDDRIWGAKGFDTLYGGRGDDRLHAFHASSGLLVGGPGHDLCVVGVGQNGQTNIETRSCEQIVYKAKQGHQG